MKFLTLLTALILLSTSGIVSAIVVKQPGVFELEPNLTLVVTAETIPGFPKKVFYYSMCYSKPGDRVLSTDRFYTPIHAGEPIVFYWDSSKRVLWMGSEKILALLPWTALEKGKYLNDHPAKYMPTTYSSTGVWRTWKAEEFPVVGGVPTGFLKEVTNTFGSTSETSGADQHATRPDAKAN